MISCALSTDPNQGTKLYVKLNTNYTIDECSVTSGCKYINIIKSLNINIQYGLYQQWAASASMEGMFCDRSQELPVSTTNQKLWEMSVEKENQLDATEWFIALIICSTCFGHLYVHNQELETICVLLPPMVCSAWLLVVGVRCRAAGYVSSKRDVATSLFLDAWPALLHLTPATKHWIP